MSEPRLPIEECDSKLARDFEWFCLIQDHRGVLTCYGAPYVAVRVSWDEDGNQHPAPQPEVDKPYRDLVYAWQEVFASALATSDIGGEEYVVFYEPMAA